MSMGKCLVSETKADATAALQVSSPPERRTDCVTIIKRLSFY